VHDALRRAPITFPSREIHSGIRRRSAINHLQIPAMTHGICF
jgi:hypothetical protein